MRSIFNEVCKIKQKYNLIALVRGRELEWMRGFRGASWRRESWGRYKQKRRQKGRKVRAAKSVRDNVGEVRGEGG